MVLAVAGGGKVHIWGSKSNLCRSLELSQASQAQPENLLPSVISSALTQMLQDPALCLTEREFCPWGGWQGTEPPPSSPHLHFRHPPVLLLLLCHIQSPATPSSCCKEVFSTGHKTSQVCQVFPQTPSAASQTLAELCVLKSDANLSTAEIFDRYEPLFFPRRNCNLRNALI